MQRRSAPRSPQRERFDEKIIGTPEIGSKIEEGIVSIPIRSGVAVRISGIPWDLTLDESERLIKIIKAYGVSPRLEIENVE